MTVLEFRTHRMNEAAEAAFKRASSFGYCPMLVREFARRARNEASMWELPAHTALRVVPPMRARNGLGEIA